MRPFALRCGGGLGHVYVYIKETTNLKHLPPTKFTGSTSTSSPLPPRERQGVTLLVVVAQQGEKRRGLLSWPRPKGVLVTEV